MKIGTVAGTNDSTTTIATNDMVQEHVTNFTKELFGYIANGIGDDISSIARTMLGEVVGKIDDWQIERFQQSIQDDKISFTIQTDHSEKYSMLSGMRAHILRRNNNYQFIVTINSKNYGCSLDNTDVNWCSIVYLLNNMTVNDNANDVAVTESYKPIWNWKISQYNVSDIKFETMINPSSLTESISPIVHPLIPQVPDQPILVIPMAQSVQFCSRFSQRDIWESWLKEKISLASCLI